MADLIESLEGLPSIGEYELLRLRSAIDYFRPMLIDSGAIKPEMVAVEIGCGRALKSIVFSDLFSEYHGIELNETELDIARSVVDRSGSNVKLHMANGVDLVKNYSKFGLMKKPDFLILYAVLEHLLPVERSEILGLARDIVNDGGAVFIAETPNRLIPYDSHSTQQHFTQSLESSLAIKAARLSKHVGWLHTFNALGANINAFFRCGAGLSYHDFEMDFSSDPTESMPFAASGWSHYLTKVQPVQNDEINLLNYFKDNDLAHHPAFARYWLEGVLSKESPKHHVYTGIGTAKNFGGQIVEDRRCWGHSYYYVTPQTPIHFELHGVQGEDFDLIAQFVGDLDGESVFFDAGEGRQNPEEVCQGASSWHKTGTLKLSCYSSPSFLTIYNESGTTPLIIKAVLINGFKRNNTSPLLDR